MPTKENLQSFCDKNNCKLTELSSTIFIIQNNSNKIQLKLNIYKNKFQNLTTKSEGNFAGKKCSPRFRTLNLLDRELKIYKR